MSPFLLDWSRYDKSTWQIIIDTHLVRANQLMTGEELLPKEVYPQQHIFEQQLRLHIQPHSHIAVISAIPLMLHEYYGACLFELLQ